MCHLREFAESSKEVTGYLVGTIDRFNTGKKAEEHDRVKHGVSIPDDLDIAI